VACVGCLNQAVVTEIVREATPHTRCDVTEAEITSELISNVQTAPFPSSSKRAGKYPAEGCRVMISCHLHHRG